MPFQMFKIACANIGAVGTMRIFGAAKTAGLASIESVITSDFITDFVIRSTAGPDKTPWVIYECTSEAPFSINSSAALHKVPAVSQMSSTMMHFFPETLPITVISAISPAFSRRLSTMAKGASIRFASSRARATPPTSGETTIISPVVSLN